MSLSVAEREKVWDDFLAAWPLQRLSGMSLAEYSTVGDKNCLTHWLESRTEPLGSIWGGAAFKFGIFERKKVEMPETDDASVTYTPTHAWFSKYGPDAATAFAAVRKEVVAAAQAASRGDARAVGDVDLGPVFKWKIAFLYQPRMHSPFLAVLNARDLCASLGRFATSKDRMFELQPLARAKFNQENILEASDACWQDRTDWVERHTLAEQLAAQIDAEPQRFTRLHATQRMIGATVNDGARPFAFTRDDRSVVAYAPAGEWTQGCKRLIKREYGASERRSSNLKTCCPQADKGHEAVALKLTSLEDFELFISAYEEREPTAVPDRDDVVEETMAGQEMPRNQILYGPPGTGKTYATVDEALRILDPAFVREQMIAGDANAARAGLKARFDELMAQGRIEFVTFHQSFSYEDFVEGIRAVVPERASEGGPGLQYEVVAGVFRKLCENARRNRSLDDQIAIAADARVWKLSIGEANGEADTRRYCFDHDEARIGWPHVGDLAAPGLRLDAPEFGLGRNDQSSLEYFGFRMAPGDVVACLNSRTTICAVGVITGPYEFTPKVPAGVREDYVHRLPVRWLWRDIDFDIVALNGGAQLTPPTAYPLARVSWPDLSSALDRTYGPARGARPAARAASQAQPHVLIIDEINRGNVSRIFGELITLIEASKRDGRPEALTITLPYSRRLFSVPDNVFLIGTMNTSDRSLASMDVALRRRFSFKAMLPQHRLLEDVLVDKRIPIGDLLATLNLRLEALLGPDQLLGHAWFMPLRSEPTLERLADIFLRQILPLLQEYFFDDWARIRLVLNDHRKTRHPELCFVRARKASAIDLFGPDESLAVTRPLWEVNAGAFLHADAYLATMGESVEEQE